MLIVNRNGAANLSNVTVINYNLYDDRWQLTAWLGGKVFFRIGEFDTKKEAEKALAEIVNAYDSGKKVYRMT